MRDIKSLKLNKEQYMFIMQRVFQEPLSWQKDLNGDGMYMEDKDLRVQIWAHKDGNVEFTTWNDDPFDSFEVTATFESTWRDHEACPASKINYNDTKGQCDLHDEWWLLPTADEVLGN